MYNLNYEKQNSGENSGFFKKLMKDPNYDKFYRIFKKLPKILAIITAALVFIWSIVDVAVFSYYGYDTYYGVMRLESCFLVLLIWWLIGAVLAYATYFFAALPVAATVVRTDAVLEINAKVKETPAEKQQND